MSTITLIICAAPLARRAGDIIHTLISRGHTVAVCPTLTAESEWGISASTTIPRQPDAVIACPLTFNTLSGWATGRNDNRALGALNDALGLGTPILAVPMLADRLVAHPAYSDHISRLSGAGVTFYSLDGTPTPEPTGIRSGTGDSFVDRFDPSVLGHWVSQVKPHLA